MPGACCCTHSTVLPCSICLYSLYFSMATINILHCASLYYTTFVLHSPNPCTANCSTQIAASHGTSLTPSCPVLHPTDKALPSCFVVTSLRQLLWSLPHAAQPHSTGQPSSPSHCHCHRGEEEQSEFKKGSLEMQGFIWLCSNQNKVKKTVWTVILFPFFNRCHIQILAQIG